MWILFPSENLRAHKCFWNAPWALIGVGGTVRFLVVGTIGKEERPPQGQLWMEQYLISLKYCSI